MYWQQCPVHQYLAVSASFFRHAHGGNDRGSTHKPSLSPHTSYPNLSSTVVIPTPSTAQSPPPRSTRGRSKLAATLAQRGAGRVRRDRLKVLPYRSTSRM